MVLIKSVIAFVFIIQQKPKAKFKKKKKVTSVTYLYYVLKLDGIHVSKVLFPFHFIFQTNLSNF